MTAGPSPRRHFCSRTSVGLDHDGEVVAGLDVERLRRAPRDDRHHLVPGHVDDDLRHHRAEHDALDRAGQLVSRAERHRRPPLAASPRGRPVALRIPARRSANECVALPGWRARTAEATVMLDRGAERAGPDRSARRAVTSASSGVGASAPTSTWPPWRTRRTTVACSLFAARRRARRRPARPPRPRGGRPGRTAAAGSGSAAAQGRSRLRGDDARVARRRASARKTLRAPRKRATASSAGRRSTSCRPAGLPQPSVDEDGAACRPARRPPRGRE